MTPAQSQSKKPVETKIKQIRPEVKQATPVKVVEISKVEYRSGYLAVWRQRDTDDWTLCGAGSQVARNVEMLEQKIPPQATEAYIIKLDLPFENK